MSDNNVRTFMRRYGREAQRLCPEIPDNVHPHLLRHRRAMHLYQGAWILHWFHNGSVMQICRPHWFMLMQIQNRNVRQSNWQNIPEVLPRRTFRLGDIRSVIKKRWKSCMNCIAVVSACGLAVRIHGLPISNRGSVVSYPRSIHLNSYLYQSNNICIINSLKTWHIINLTYTSQPAGRKDMRTCRQDSEVHCDFLFPWLFRLQVRGSCHST